MAAVCGAGVSAGETGMGAGSGRMGGFQSGTPSLQSGTATVRKKAASPEFRSCTAAEESSSMVKICPAAESG
ncbi:MAG TPA: hypothetical protein VGD42_10995, partial [Lysobacter sp.]